MIPDPINIKQIGVAEIDTLLQLSRDTFFTAFAHQNNPGDMATYAEKAFTKVKLMAELNDPDSKFYFPYLNEQVAGYIKLNFKTAQTEFQDPEAMEIARIYVSASYQNKQIGKQLLSFAIKQASIRELKYVWLGAWDKNINAIRFYEQNGFEIFGSHEFILGNDKQTDLLLKKSLI